MIDNKLNFEQHLLRLKVLKYAVDFFNDAIELELSNLEILNKHLEIAKKDFEYSKTQFINKYSSDISELRFMKLVEDHEVGYL